MAELADIEAFWTVDEAKAKETVISMMRWLRYACRHGFDLDAFLADEDAARREGRAWLLSRSRWVGPATYNNATKWLNGLARFAGYETLSFKPRPVRRSDPKVYSDQELRAIWRYKNRHKEMERRTLALKHCSVMTGLRRSEIWWLETDDLDREARTVYVRKPAKGGPVRTIPVPAELWDPTRPFAQWLRVRPVAPEDPGRVWTTGHAGRPRVVALASLNNALSKVGAAVGFPVNFIRGRHTVATRLHRAGHSLLSIMFILGHKDPKSTLVYTFVTLEDVQEAYRRIDLGSVFGPKGGPEE